MRSRFLIPTLSLALAAASCARKAPDAAPDDEVPTVAVTIWTARSELFAEHPVLAVGEAARFAVHLTDLTTFKPLTKGTVRVHMAGPKTEVFTGNAPSRPGIFGVTVTPTTAGRYTLKIDVAGPLEDSFDLGEVEVFATLAEARAFKVDEPAEERIAFLKEQQWALDFGTALAEPRKMRPSLLVSGEVRPPTGGESVLAAPVSGRLVSAATVAIGSAVGAGDVLAQILPQSSAPADRPALELALRDAQAQLELAGAERARAERLTRAGAAPARRLGEAEVAERSARSAVEAAEKRLTQLDLTRTGQGQAADDARFLVRAPAAGVLVESRATPGAAVEQGQLLFRVVAVDVVHVVAYLPEADMPRAGVIADADLMAPARTTPVRLGAPTSRGRVLDARSRTLPVIFSLSRPPSWLAVGQRVSVRLYTSSGIEAVAVPVSALVDDAGRPVVFIQREGEAFVRRPVTLGARDGAYVVAEGVQRGDRVVIRGAPLVRLAALSTAVPAHGHVH